jgi:hypothetical protein
MILLKRKIQLWTDEELRNMVLSPYEHTEVNRSKALSALEFRANQKGWREGHDEGYEDGQRIPNFRA